MSKAFLVAGGVALLAFACAAPARSANANTLSGYLEYVTNWAGDTYNGVTTSDGENFPESFTAKARLNYGHFAASLKVYRDVTWSDANATTASGSAGTLISYPAANVIVPVFVAVDSASEIRLEYQPPKLPVYFGFAYSNQSNSYNFPRLLAVGIGVELMPNPKHVFSPYGSYFFFPNQTGTYPLANPFDPASGSVGTSFRANELELGGSYAIPKSDLSVVGGYYQNTNIARTATFNFVRDGLFIGLGFRTR